jgi:hypothetical protein
MLVLAMLAAASVPFQFHVEVSEFPNVVYHVGCLSERNPCTKASVEKFWHEDLHWTDVDQQKLDQWNKVMDAVAKRQPKPPERPFVPNFSGDVTGRLMAAGLDSRSPADFRRRAAGLAEAGEVAQLGDTLAHFQRRFHPWWKSNGEAYAMARRRELQRAMQAPGLARLAEQIARFMEAEVTNGVYQLDLLPRNDRKSDAEIATVVGNHLLVEVTDSIKVDQAAPVFLHELTHSLYELAPLSSKEKLMRDFAAAKEPHSQALYALMNEGIATAVQMHLIPTAEADQDVYRDPFIPRIGRAVSKPLAEALEHGPTLFHGFMDTYLRAGAAEMGEELATPRFTLVTAMYLQVEKLPLASRAYDQNFAAHWTANFSERDRFPELNLVILLTYDKLDAIEGNWDEIVPLSKAHRGFAFAAKRNSKGHSFVLAARDDATLAEVVKRLAAIRTGPGEGVRVTID